MKTEKQIRTMIDALGDGVITLGAKKEVKFLPQIIQDDEEILNLTSGLMDANTWLVVATNKRIIFLDKGMIFGLKQIEVPLDKVNSITQNTGLLFGTITIFDGVSEKEIRNVAKSSVTPFANAVNAALQNRNRREPQPQASNHLTINDSKERLDRIKVMFDQGILTESEYSEKRKEIISLM